jgi:hypothetical protein
MSRISKEHVHRALDKAAENILKARGDDQIVSRRDIRNQLQQLSGVERSLTDIFYRFIDHRDNKPGARITEADVEETLAYAKEKLIDAYDLNNNGLSNDEIEKMSLTGKLAVQFARLLKDASIRESIETTENLLPVLKELGEGLYFPAWANESTATLKLFHREADLQELTPATFSAVLNLSQKDLSEAVYFFHRGMDEMAWIFENYDSYDAMEELQRFRRLYNFMNDHLKDVTHIVVGHDGERMSSEYPVYLIGIGPDGDLVGFETFTVWT